MSWLYIIALSADCIAVVVAFYFIYTDFVSYSSSSNGALSAVTLALCAWTGISYYLYTHGWPRIGAIMAWIPAFPLLGYGLMILLMVVFKPDFR